MATEEARNLDEARATMANTQVSGNSQANGKNQAIDNSNPQQGTDSEKKPDFQVPVGKIPPTARDDRKLFVGGLPSDGTWGLPISTHCSHILFHLYPTNYFSMLKSRNRSFVCFLSNSVL